MNGDSVQIELLRVFKVNYSFIVFDVDKYTNEDTFKCHCETASEVRNLITETI